MAKREFLMLAHEFVPSKHRLAGMFVSEKLDGMRVFWDGGVSRGCLKKDVPWANTAKDERYIHEPVASGLWTRYGNVIIAPDWWLDSLPPYPLDGELYLPEGRRQDLLSIAKDLVPNDALWKLVRYYVFDSPSITEVVLDGTINCGVNFKKTLKGGIEWWVARAQEKGIRTREPGIFERTYKWLQGQDLGAYCVLHEQRELPFLTADAQEAVSRFLGEVVEKGGEGLILRSRQSLWLPRRSYDLLKIKPRHDSEATITGYTWGVEGKEGKLLGLMGSLELLWTNPLGKQVAFNISGFTEAERIMVFKETGQSASGIGRLQPGARVSSDIHNPLFRVGMKITFKYRTLTNEGKPEEASYWRPAE